MIAIVGLLALSLPAGEPLSAGLATVDITPPVGYRMSGYFYERLSTGVRDPLQAKCLVLAQGGQQVAFVFCDLIGVTGEVSGPVREAAGRQTGIPREHIVIAATHSHTGPLYDGALREYFHRKAIAAHGSDPCEKVDYADQLRRKLVESIKRASAAIRPVHLEAGSIEQSPTISFNRRFHMKEGPVRFNPGSLNPDIVRPAGPVDPEIGVLLLRDAGTNRPIASLTSFSLHADTTGGTEYSADYPLYLEQALRAEWGAGFVSLFGPGCCGDVNHIDVTRSDRRSAQQLGTVLGGSVLRAVRTLRKAERPALAVRRQVINLALQRPGQQELTKAQADMATVGAKEPPFLEQVRTCKLESLRLLGRPELPVDVQVFRLSNDLAVVTLPGEVFVELGLAIKKASPFKTTLVIELANDSIHYVPTRQAFDEGSYETVNCIIEPGQGERLVEAATAMLRQLAE